MNKDSQLYNYNNLSMKDKEKFGRTEIDSGSARFMHSLVKVDKLQNDLESSLQEIDNLKPDTSIKVEGLGYLTEIDLGTMISSFTVDNDKNYGTITAVDHNNDVITYSKNISTGEETITRRVGKTPEGLEIHRLGLFPFYMINKLSGIGVNPGVKWKTGTYVESIGSNVDDALWSVTQLPNVRIMYNVQDYTYWGSRYFFCKIEGGIVQTSGRPISQRNKTKDYFDETKGESYETITILPHVQFQACVLDGPHQRLYALDNLSNGNNVYVFGLNKNLEFIKTVSSMKREDNNEGTNIQCSADYGKNDVCCGQPPAHDDYRGNVRACPPSHPTCDNYVANQHYGKCINTFEITNYNYQVIKPSIPNVYLNNLVPIPRKNSNIINSSEVELIFVGTNIGDTSGKVNLYSGKIIYGNKEGVFPTPNCSYINEDIGIMRRCGEENINIYGLKPTHTKAYTSWGKRRNNYPPKYEYKLPFDASNIENIQLKMAEDAKQMSRDYGIQKMVDYQNFIGDKGKLDKKIYENAMYVNKHGDGSNYKAGGIIGKTIFPVLEYEKPTLSQCKNVCLSFGDRCKGILFGDKTIDAKDSSGIDQYENECFIKVDNTKEDKTPGYTSYSKIYHPEQPDTLQVNISKNIRKCNETISEELDCKILRGAVLELTKLVDQNFSGIEYIKLKKEDNFLNKGDELYNMVSNAMNNTNKNNDESVRRYIDLKFSESSGDILVLLDGIILKYPLSNLYNLKSTKGVPTFRDMVDVPILKIKKSIEDMMGEYKSGKDMQNILDNNLIKQRNTELLNSVVLVNKELEKLKPVESQNKKLEQSLNDSNMGVTTRSMTLVMWVILVIISTIFIILHFLMPDLVPTNILITYIALIAVIIVISKRYLSKKNIRDIQKNISDILSYFTFSKIKKYFYLNYKNRY